MHDIAYLGQQSTGLCAPSQLSIRERLEERKKSFEGQLRNVNEALEALNKNPEFEKFHDAVIKAGF